MATLDCSQEELRAYLLDPKLDTEWKATIAEWSDASDASKAETLEWIRSMRDEFVGVISIVDDPEDLCYCAVVRYIEVKCRWILLNNQVNYTMVRTGSPPDEVMYRACIAAQLLAALEVHIRSHHVEAITDFLAEPTAVPDLGGGMPPPIVNVKKKMS
ncbi:MAG: hypothetical protein EA402_05275 [Planctomycetota bacterium]|nr:MAG: hypothetical protein EA402_05275 [Planctomycetota bacterium]